LFYLFGMTRLLCAQSCRMVLHSNVWFIDRWPGLKPKLIYIYINLFDERQHRPRANAPDNDGVNQNAGVACRFSKEILGSYSRTILLKSSRANHKQQKQASVTRTRCFRQLPQSTELVKS